MKEYNPKVTPWQIKEQDFPQYRECNIHNTPSGWTMLNQNQNILPGVPWPKS